MPSFDPASAGSQNLHSPKILRSIASRRHHLLWRNYNVWHNLFVRRDMSLRIGFKNDALHEDVKSLTRIRTTSNNRNRNLVPENDERLCRHALLVTSLGNGGVL